jgi:hypothetical protein
MRIGRDKSNDWRDRLQDPVRYYSLHVVKLGSRNGAGWAQGLGFRILIAAKTFAIRSASHTQRLQHSHMLTRSLPTLQKAQKAIQNPVAIPAGLSKTEVNYFVTMSQTRASFDWSEHDIEYIGRIAKMKARADLFWAQEELDKALQVERLIVVMLSKLSIFTMSTGGMRREIAGVRARVSREARHAKDAIDAELVG